MGLAVGDSVGDDVGAAVGAVVGVAVGALVGTAVGVEVGDWVCHTHLPRCGTYPWLHVSSQLFFLPCAPRVMWCACSLGVLHGTHSPALSW